MSADAQVLEFPGFADLPRREKSKIVKIWELFASMKKVVEEKGLLIPQVLAAKLLDVCPQRITQLIEAGKLETHEVNGVRFVTENSVVEYARSERKRGRPVKTDYSRKEAWALSRSVNKEIVAEARKVITIK
jgi:hypothetical protein